KLARRMAWLLTVMPPVFIRSRPALNWTLHQEVGEMEESQGLVVGVDTHKESHSAALVDELGAVLGSTDVEANQRGYVQLLQWARGRSSHRTWVVEGTGSYGAGLRSEEHTSELQSLRHLVCRLLLEKKNPDTTCI